MTKNRIIKQHLTYPMTYHEATDISVIIIKRMQMYKKLKETTDKNKTF